ncbi:MAG: MFS transporter [Coriobacteriales bacterium]|jgi:OFA family oxalate/formate antiporter-like MFS transporter|nr:MFS transporter [Coriobacteriales bacterium]
MSATELSLASIKSKRMLYLVFATITLLVLGLIYAWSIFASPLARDFPDYQGLLPQVFQVSMFAFCVSALFGAQLIKKTSAKLAIIVAAVLLGAGFLLTAVGAGWSVWTLYAFYGILAGSGCGIAYNAIISLVNPWWPDRIGFASGVQMMGFGLASLVFGTVANALFGIMPWQTVFILIAAVGMAALICLAIIVRPAPANIEQILTGAATKAGSSAPKTSATQQQNILTTRVFWLFCVWATITIACGLTLIGSAKQGAEALGVDPAFAAVLVGLVSGLNGLGRVINGAIFDKFGLVPVMVIGALFAIVTMAALAFAFTTLTGPIYIVAAILVAFPYSAVPVMASAYARQRYGPIGFAKNLGIANLNIASAALLNILIAALFGPIKSPVDAGDTTIYMLLALLAVIALVFALLFGRAYKADLEKIRGELS